MENEKNKDSTHDDITNKNNIVESESNHNFSDKTSDDFHSMHNRKIKLNEEKINSESQKILMMKINIEIMILLLKSKVIMIK